MTKTARKSLYSLRIVFHDFPASTRSTVERVVVELTTTEAEEFKKRLLDNFARHGDGNDCCYSLTMDKIASQPQTKEWLAAWIDKFVADEDLDESQAPPAYDPNWADG